MITLDQVLNTKIPNKNPTIGERYPNSEIYLRKKTGGVSVYHNENHYTTQHNWGSHQEFLDSTGMGKKEFDSMYYFDHEVSKLLKKKFSDIDLVLIADL